MWGFFGVSWKDRCFSKGQTPDRTGDVDAMVAAQRKIPSSTSSGVSGRGFEKALHYLPGPAGQKDPPGFCSSGISTEIR